MTPKQAKEILLAMDCDGITGDYLVCGYPVICCHTDAPTLYRLDGEFTADQLEAIATWMRDPKGVAGA